MLVLFAAMCIYGYVSVYHFIWPFSVKGTYVNFPPMSIHFFLLLYFLLYSPRIMLSPLWFK